MITVLEFNQITGDETDNDNNKIINKSMAHSNKLAAIQKMAAETKVTMVPLKKLSVFKFATSPEKNLEKNLPITLGKTEVYQERKRMLPEYKDLFAALMKLQDKEVQKKIFDVINKHKSVEYRTVETQTDPVEIREQIPQTYIKQETPINDVSVSDKSPNLAINEDSTHKSIDNMADEVTKKRKRKRKVSIPQANKESRAKQLAKMNKPKTATTNGSNNATTSTEQSSSSMIKRQRINSCCISECSSDVANMFEDTEPDFLKEVNESFVWDNGLLPIHDAIIKNQTNILSMQIFIWKNLKNIDLNELLTDEDEDLLQLAVLNTCDPSIISLLLEKGLNTDCLDADSNTIIHLAMLNDINVAALKHLMKRIDLKLLLTINDDGFTPLHLGVRQDRYLLVESLINILDERLMKQKFYIREIDELETDESVLKKQFKNFYEKVCLQMSVDEEENLCPINNHELKQKLLQTGDRRSGNTALYFAIDNKFEHLIYFLLAHLIDPRTENLSGQDCKTYFSEFGKSLRLSLNIDNTMEKVIKLLS